MAIEKVKRTWFLVPRGELDRFIEKLAGSRTTHAVDLRDEAAEGLAAMTAPPGRTAARAADAEEKVNHLSRVLDILDDFAPPKRAFHENFVTLPAEMTREEFDRSVQDTDADELFARATSVHRDHAAAAKRAEDLGARVARLEPWAAAGLPPPGLSRCDTDLGAVSAKGLPKLERAAAGLEGLALRCVLQSDSRALVAAVWLREAGAGAAELLEAHGFESLGLEGGAGRVADVLDRLRAELDAAKQETGRLEAQGIELAGRRRAVLAALASWGARLEQEAAFDKTVASRRIAVLSGYVRVREMAKLEELLGRDFPSVSLVAEDPKPGEDVPVSLGGSKLFAPAQFLTSMFGLPNYFEFDPSPYIFITFLIFFGFCFGDVVYGLMLVGLGWWLSRKSSDYPSLARFFSLLMWCGMSSIIVGAITGSWAADLLSEKYIGEGNIIAGVRARLMLIDPMEKTVVVLLVALGIGMLNQFYGMILLMYREWRRGDVFAAVCDGGLWLVFLPGLVLLLIGAVAARPGLRAVALWMVILSGAGLVLTQGRREKTLLGKAITGVVSLYGILGTYGTTSFIADTLSYSRLLALGLTTVIVGMSFNIIAGLVRSLPLFGILAFIAVVVFGHLFNFLISILGGFVHSARLIFVEFFTKFYEGGARPFAPLGAPKTVRVIDEG